MDSRNLLEIVLKVMAPVAVAEPHHFVVAGAEGADAEPDLTLHGIAIASNHINY